MPAGDSFFRALWLTLGCAGQAMGCFSETTLERNSVDVSILIVNWNTCRHLRECLESIQRTVSGLEIEVIVVDNASTDGSTEMVRSEFPWVILVASPENVGFARGNNLALSRASGDYVLVINPDVVFLEGTLAGLATFARERPDAGATSPKLVNPDGTFQNFHGRVPNLSILFFVYTHLGRWVDKHLLRNRVRRRARYEEYGDFQEILALSDGGAGFSCSLIPRRVIERIGFMDERFPVFFNDADFVMRMFGENYRVYILPHVQAIHYGGSSVKQLDLLVYNQEWVYGIRTFYRQYRGFLFNRVLDFFLGLNVLVELAPSLKAVLQRKKSLFSFFQPLVSFRKALAYRPGNARPHIFKLPERPEE
jgi:N-acetylglucosaminyl-diphospho-decaprenol L-rhamnosyltransferase